MTGASRRAALAAAAAATLAPFAHAAGDVSHHDHGALPVGGETSAFEREMDASMAAMMQAMHAPGYSGDADADFLAMMVPHHQGAIDMARLVLQHGRDPVTRQLAEEIIAGQAVEIEGMTWRLAMLRQGRSARGDAEFPALGGTRGP